jgi:hypothetical protein
MKWSHGMLVCVWEYTHSMWHYHARWHAYQYEPQSTDKQLIKSLLITCSHYNKKPKYFGNKVAKYFILRTVHVTIIHIKHDELLLHGDTLCLT